MKPVDPIDNEALIIEIDNSIRVYRVNQTAIDFKNWFETIFSIQNPLIADGFMFSEIRIEKEPYLELLSGVPTVPIEALEEMFFASKAGGRPIKPPKPSLKIVA